MNFSFKTKYGKYDHCFFRTGKYADNTPSIQIRQNTECGVEPILTATVSLGVPLPDGCILVKNYSENEGVLEFLKNLGVVTKVMCYLPSGYVSIPVCKYDPKILARYTH